LVFPSIFRGLFSGVFRVYVKGNLPKKRFIDIPQKKVMMKNKAKESRQVMQARKKLKKTLEVEHKRFTSSALHEMALKIRALISRKHTDEDSLKNRKVIVLPDSKNKKILKLQALIKKDYTRQ
jgi:hypothetical protein